MTTIRVADHARSPGGRYSSDGPSSGEWFREKVLRPALDRAAKTGEMVVVELDGTSGYGSSFLEEAFGGLVRTRAFRRDQLHNLLRVVAKTPLFAPYAILANQFIEQAAHQPAE
jgi:hypothetical protein